MLKLLLVAALGSVVPVAAQQPDNDSGSCRDSRAAFVADPTERLVQPAFFEARHETLLP